MRKLPAHSPKHQQTREARFHRSTETGSSQLQNLAAFRRLLLCLRSQKMRADPAAAKLNAACGPSPTTTGWRLRFYFTRQTKIRPAREYATSKLIPDETKGRRSKTPLHLTAATPSADHSSCPRHSEPQADGVILEMAMIYQHKTGLQQHHQKRRRPNGRPRFLRGYLHLGRSSQPKQASDTTQDRRDNIRGQTPVMTYP